jgi:hypothetical protein
MAETAIKVECVGREEPMRFQVILREGRDATRHNVTLRRETIGRLSCGDRDADKIVEAALRFLLAREPKESILASFDVSVISRYFPEFERELPNYLDPRP